MLVISLTQGEVLKHFSIIKKIQYEIGGAIMGRYGDNKLVQRSACITYWRRQW
jgi:hypothetical protein